MFDSLSLPSHGDAADADSVTPPDGERSESNSGAKSRLLLLSCVLVLGFVGAILSVPASTHTASATANEQRQLSPIIPQPFSFDAGFGDNMVLQHGKNTHSAVYGFLGPDCEGVQVRLYKASPTDPHEHAIFSNEHAGINSTHQPFNKNAKTNTWGPRPCTEQGCPTGKGAWFNSYERQSFNPWNEPLPKWKVLLPPQEHAGGNYTIEAKCIKSSNHKPAGESVRLYNVTFGDVWYCSGQSNMALPLKHSFHKRDIANAILSENKYHNIHMMAGKSQQKVYGIESSDWNYAKYGSADGTNPWMTSLQAVGHDGSDESPFMQFGAACWHFAQHLTELGVDHPIGLINTAIGGRRIQEFMDNRTIAQCHNRTVAGQRNQEDNVWWESQLYASQILPFVDMTVKGFLWYQGENNMHEVKGNSLHNVGYGCEMEALIRSWRKVWSEKPKTTSPTAPFGIVTIAHGGDEGGPDMGAMRHAQSANYGVLPPPHHPIIEDDHSHAFVKEEIALANTFLAQAYDLRDEWDGNHGPCYEKKCCVEEEEYDPNVCSNQTFHDLCNSEGACAISKNTPYYMGIIHPRNKQEVGQRLAIAAYNLFFGGEEAYTGPTLEGCSVLEETDTPNLEIRFNSTLLRGDALAEPEIAPKVILPPYNRPVGGSQLYVQTQASLFCMEESVVFKGKLRQSGTTFICPTWAGGDEAQSTTPTKNLYDQGWTEVPFVVKNSNTIVADLSGLPDGATPTAVQYAWGLVDCCDYTDPDLFVTKSCIANCPIKTLQGQLPANPFKAKIVDGHCKCIPPQKCSDDGDESSGVN